MRNLEPFIDALQIALLGDTEEEGISYLQSREIPYRIVMKDEKTSGTHMLNYTRLNLVIEGKYITRIYLG